MTNYLLGFPNKKERDDFLIAIVVILFFISLFWFFMVRGDGPKLDASIIPTAEIIEEDIDTDLDGITDSKDICPNIAGIFANGGCPADSDEDGIYDQDDRCPKLAGVSSNKGCPADSDKDGIYDRDDKCPKVPGNSENGCPPDTDGDGVFDHLDKCPNEKGSKENMGCPFTARDEAIIRNIQSSVEFETGRAILTKASLIKLDELAKLLKKYPEVKMRIEGYTDSEGDDVKNQILSKNRALACRTYLEEKGIASRRLKSQGFGERKPVATNKTEEGRRKNRRVEFKSF